MVELNLRKVLNGTDPFLLDVKMKLSDSEIVAVTGKSGSGKTTLLRMIAGFEKPDNGTIVSDGSVWYDSEAKRFVPPFKRYLAFAFQNYALFPHLTVNKNISCGSRACDENYVNRLLQRVGLGGFGMRKIHELSGGQKQRVAFLRAIVRNAPLMLLDEPFSALDSENRCIFRTLLLERQKKSGCSIVLVSHDPSDIQEVAQRTIIIKSGSTVEM
ncbi:MAG: ATP-binding cassette domain-containing protein [Chitinispirillaceae bacterium]